MMSGMGGKPNNHLAVKPSVSLKGHWHSSAQLLLLLLATVLNGIVDTNPLLRSQYMRGKGQVKLAFIKL